LELFTDYVVTARKEAVLLRIEKMDLQSAAACEDEIKRLSERVVVLERKLAEFGHLTDDDMEPSMVAEQFRLKEDVRKLGQKIAEHNSELRAKRADRDVLAPLVPAAASPAQLKAIIDQIEQLELQIKNSQESIVADEEQLRALPIVMTKTERNKQVAKLAWLKVQIKDHEAAKASIGKPGGPPARGDLVGTDAKEFTVNSKPRVGDKPASSSRKALFAMTFMGLMAAAFGLLFVYDRRYPVPEGPSMRPRVVHVTPPPGSTLNGADAHRLAAGLQAWIREANGAIVTPPPVTINPDGHVENTSPPANGDADNDMLASRMEQWLGDGHGPG
jgi:hypothetical protein